MAAMRIAVVSQVVDGIAPDGLNSVGLVGHYLARDLARDHQVTVYGSAGVAANGGEWPATADDGIVYRVMPPRLTDTVVARAWPYVTRMAGQIRGGLRPPVSTATWSGLGYARRVAADIAAQHFDVIHVHHATQYLPALRAAAPRAIIVLHAHAEWFPQTPRAVLQRRLAHADAVVGCSDYVTARLVDYLPSLAGRCFTVYNGVSTAEFHPGGRTVPRPGPAPFVLYVGGVSPHKGLHDLISAFVPVARQMPELELRIVGSEGNYPIEEILDLTDRTAVTRLLPFYAGRYLDRLRSMVPSDVAGRVTFTGRLSPEDLVDHYLSAAVFAFPSVWPEGFGLPPVEAMAAGVPVVATRAGAITETVVDGVTGYLVGQGDVAALTDRLGALLADEGRRRSFGEAGRARAVTTFDWSVVAGDLRRVYDRLAAGRGPAPT
jgi:glycosyltransferase involved in cell wall biosynthesis